MKQLVIMPGGFHPFHTGHMNLYNDAKKAFPNADVYVAATNDTSERPFPFPVKQKLAKLAGVPENRFVQVSSPFRAEEITKKYDPKNTVLIFVRSEKDANSPPVPGRVKKDGQPGYLQPLSDDLEPMSQHAYMTYMPTVEFGPGITSASEIRSAWPSLNEKRKTAMVMSLYPKTQSNPKLAATVVKLLDTAMGSSLTEQPNQAGTSSGSAPAPVANTQPATSTAATNTNTAGNTQTSAGSTSTQPTPSVGAVTQSDTTATSTGSTSSTSVTPDADLVNLAKKLGVDPKKLQSELATMKEDYLSEKRN